MLKIINLANKKSALKVLEETKNSKNCNYDIRIHNSHITELNRVLGRKVFKKDALYINSGTLKEIMLPVGRSGKHHHQHGLSPIEIFSALSTIKDSNDVSISYGNRYIIVTLATIYNGVNLVVIVEPNSALLNHLNAKIIKIITIYPKNISYK